MAGDDVLAASKTILADEWGVSVSYRISPAASGSAATTVPGVVVIPGKIVTGDGLLGDANTRRRTVEVPLAFVPAPQVGDQFTVGGETWSVDEVGQVEGGYALVGAKVLRVRPG